MGKFKKGQSGNPSGRKPGTLNKRSQLAKLLEPHAEKLINKTVELAMEGDVNALRLCIERLIPKITSQHLQIDLKDFDLENDFNLSSVGKKIIEAVANSIITPDDGQQLMGLLDSQRKLIEHVDIIKRVSILEENQRTGLLDSDF